MAAPLGVQADSSILSMPGAELRLLAARDAVMCHCCAAFVSAPPCLAAEVDHASLGMPDAEPWFLVALHRVAWLRGATLVGAHLAADVGHPILGMRGAELRLFLAIVQAKARACRAAWVCAPRGPDVHRALLRVLGAELHCLTAGRPKACSCGAPCTPALLDMSHAYHALPGVLGARLPLAAASHAERRILSAAKVTAPLGGHIDHAFLGMPGTKLGFSASLRAVAWLLRALWVGAPPLLPDADHAVYGVSRAEFWFLASFNCVAGTFGAARVATSFGHSCSAVA